MNRRTLAIVIAVPLTAILLLAALAMPIPYVIYRPGNTVDLLSEVGGRERIRVEGHPTYYDDGELRMTTIYVTDPGDKITLATALAGWIRRDDAVKPYASVYDDDETEEEKDEQSALQMSSSQDDAVAVALTALGEDVKVVPVVGLLTPGLPADGKLEVGDQFLQIGDTPIKGYEDVAKVVGAAKAGEPLAFVVKRDGKRQTVEISPVESEGRVRVGVEIGVDYEFPFDVTIDIDANIGGPSAGLMFSLSIYDTLTPGSLTGGHEIAGTGTIGPDGRVGPIGGIQQKIAAARDAKVQLFLVPADNCDEAVGAPNDDVRLAKVGTMQEALDVLKKYVADPDADLPSCEDED
jgi:Lon-like protease